MKDINNMTIEELIKYKYELLENLKPVGTTYEMEEIVKVHNLILKLKNKE